MAERASAVNLRGRRHLTGSPSVAPCLPPPGPLTTSASAPDLLQSRPRSRKSSNNHPWLHRNIKLNELESTTTVHECGLSDEAGVATMDWGEAGLAGGGGNAAIALAEGAVGVPVPLVPLDSLSRPARVSVIKIDVEGFELRALRGAEQLITQDQPVIFGEFSDWWLRDRGEDIAPFLDDLRAGGYEVYSVEEVRSRPWRATDLTRLRRIPSGQQAHDLLLLPARVAIRK